MVRIAQHHRDRFPLARDTSETTPAASERGSLASQQASTKRSCLAVQSRAPLGKFRQRSAWSCADQVPRLTGPVGSDSYCAAGCEPAHSGAQPRDERPPRTGLARDFAMTHGGTNLSPSLCCGGGGEVLECSSSCHSLNSSLPANFQLPVFSPQPSVPDGRSQEE